VLTAALCVGSLLSWFLPALWLDWQPALAWQQPWRAWTSVWVHWSLLHLGANLFAAVVVGAYGYSARMPVSATLAWLAAWPLTQLGMLLLPHLSQSLLHYGGLSGMLHGGVAIVCAELLFKQQGARRWVGAAVSLGLVIKLVSEAPWGPVLRESADWDIAVVPLAHSSGAVAGLLCWLLLQGAGALKGR